MEVKVLWSDTAISKIQEIFDYYEFKASTTVAKKIVKGIVKKNSSFRIKSTHRSKRTIDY